MSAYLRKHGAAATINFDLFEVDGVDFRVDAVHAAGDTKIMKDEGVEANTTNGFVDEGQGYSIALTATEMTAARVVVYVVDQTATKVWLDRTIIIETYGNASAQHAFDLDTATPNVNVASEDDIDFGSTKKASIETAVEAGLEDAGQVMVITTIATLTSQTIFTLTDGATINDTYIDCLALIEDLVNVNEKAVGIIKDYDGSTKTVTLALDPPGILYNAGDKIAIIHWSAVNAWAGQTVKGLLNGRVEAAVEAMGTDVITESALQAAGVGKIANKVWDELKSGHVASGSFGEEVQAHALETTVVAQNDISPAEVNAEMLDVMDTDTYGEPSGSPPSTTTIFVMIRHLFKNLRGKKTGSLEEGG